MSDFYPQMTYFESVSILEVFKRILSFSPFIRMFFVTVFLGLRLLGDLSLDFGLLACLKLLLIMKLAFILLFDYAVSPVCSLPGPVLALLQLQLLGFLSLDFDIDLE